MNSSAVEKDEKGGGVPADTAAGQTAGEVALNKYGFELFPQPVSGDALDPLNWTFPQKHTVLAIVMALYFMFTYITTTTVPSFPELMDQYSITLEQTNWTVAIPALGLALGPLIWSSPADIIGRRPIFIIGTVMAFAASIGAALAPTYSTYTAARFFQGLGVSPASNVGLSIINDMFFAYERGQKVGLWVLAIDLGLLFGPLIGGFVNIAGHAWIQWVSAIVLGMLALCELAFLPETLYPRDLMQTRLRQGGGHGAGGFEEKGVAEEGLATTDAVEIRRTKKLPFVNVSPVPGVRHPKPWEALIRFAKTFKYVVVPLSVMTYCFGWYWWVLSVVTLVPVAYESFSSQSQGLLFLGLIIGTLVSEIFCSGRLSDWLVIKLARRNGNVRTPEMRIWLSYPAMLLTAVGLIVWGISVDRGYHWVVGQVAFVFFGAGIQMGNTAICSYVTDAYPKQSMAVMTFFAGHAIITVFFCVPVIGLVHRFGEYLREKSGTPTWVNPEFDTDMPA